MPEKRLHPIRIGEVEYVNNLFLAPLAGFSHIALRQTALRFGAGATVTEMVSAEGVLRRDRNAWSYLAGTNPQTIVQLFGAVAPERMGLAAKLICEELGARVIDLNFGCPVRKVIKTGAGSAMLREPSIMREMVLAVKESGAAATAKIRSGFDSVNLEQTIPALRDADAIVLHPRLGVQGFTGNADWSLIALARQMTDQTLIASGDITTPVKAKECLETTGADAIMIGRAAVGKPFLFRQIAEYLETGSYEGFEKPAVKRMVLEFLQDYIEWNPRQSLIPIRGGLLQMIKGYEGNKELRVKICTLKTAEEAMREVVNWV